MENLKNIEEKIVQVITGFYKDYLGDYVTAYFSWVADLLSGTEPFTMLAISIFLSFVMMVYLWYRSRHC